MVMPIDSFSYTSNSGKYKLLHNTSKASERTETTAEVVTSNNKHPIVAIKNSKSVNFFFPNPFTNYPLQPLIIAKN